MIEDPIVSEVRRAREELAARYGYDVRAIGRALRKQQAASGRKLVSFPPKRLPAVGTTAAVRTGKKHTGAKCVAARAGR